jgi:hypothetical protein
MNLVLEDKSLTKAVRNELWEKARDKKDTLKKW